MCTCSYTSRRGTEKKRTAYYLTTSKYGNLNVASLLYFPIESSSLPVVVAYHQPDERLGNRNQKRRACARDCVHKCTRAYATIPQLFEAHQPQLQIPSLQLLQQVKLML